MEGRDGGARGRNSHLSLISYSFNYMVYFLLAQNNGVKVISCQMEMLQSFLGREEQNSEDGWRGNITKVNLVTDSWDKITN